jgi:RIO kinase 2
VKQNRDYLQGQKSASWMFLSRLAAQKEFEFMKVAPLLYDTDSKILYDNGFPVPQPIDQNRHQVVMEFIDAFPLYSPIVNF